MSWTDNSAKNKHYDVTTIWSVTSPERGVLALWRYIRRLFLHTQIGAKTMFTSE